MIKIGKIYLTREMKKKEFFIYNSFNSILSNGRKK